MERRGALVIGIGLDGDEACQGSSELAVEGDFVAEEEFGGGCGGRLVEGEDGAHFGRPEERVLKRHFSIERDLLESPDAELAPAGDGHGLDQHELRGRGGMELVNKGAEES